MNAHIEHADGFAAAVASSGALPRQAADLGSGGGVPALPLALRYGNCRWILVESGVRRATFLREAVAILGIDDRVTVIHDRAEVVGRDLQWRGTSDLVTARGFGPPAVVAECGAPLLTVGGRAVISEPPGGAPLRWPDDGLGLVGMTTGPAIAAGGATYQVLRQATPCPDRFPRRVGVPAKRPLF